MTAVISECGEYRYSLGRRLASGSRFVLWVMLNPSTADATTNDPTIRRCIGFTRLWGYDGLLVGNLYGLRTPEPRWLANADDPVGPKNDHHLHELAARATLIVCAWGKPGPQKDRPAKVLEILRGHAPEVTALGFTKSGEPRHPLMLPKALTPQRWAA
jgi:hypothetical protein